MNAVFSLLLVLIMVAIVALQFRSGLWSNLILFFNVITAALVATNYWEPLASFLTRQIPSGVYLWDVVALWGIFAAVYALLKAATDRASRMRVKFPKVVELMGNLVILTWAGWVVVCFATFTFHTAPLARNFLGGGFQAEKPLFFSVLYPDRLWLGLVQQQSLGGLGRAGTAQDPEAHVFDPHSEFMIKYAARREKFESLKGLFVGSGP